MTKKYNKYFAAFFLPLIFAAVGLALAGVYPFYGKSITSSDIGLQYMPMTAAAARCIKSGESLTVTYDFDFGTDFLAIGYIAYSSILNILFLLFDAKFHQDVYYFIYLLKIGFAGIAGFVYFSKSRIIKNGDGINIAFAVLYAVCMHFMYYVLQINLLDAAVLLPLCFLAAEQLDKKPWLFVLAYAPCVLSYYYFAYISGIMCFLYVLYFHSVIGSDLKAQAKSIIKLCITALVSIGLTAFLLFPELSAVMSGYRDVFDSSPFAPLFYFSPGELFDGLFFISDKQVMDAGLNIRFGIMPLMLTFMLIFSPKAVSKKERIASALICIFMAAALTVKPLYLLMHLGKIPQGFHARFIYGTVLFFLIFSSRMIMHRQNISKKAVVFSAVFMLFGLCMALPLHTRLKYLVYAVLTFCLCIFYAVWFSAFFQKKYFMTITAAAIAAEAFLNAAAGIYITSRGAGMPPRDVFPTQIQNSLHTKKALDETDSSFYRCYDITETDTMSQLYGGFSCYSFFSSVANQYTADFAEALGCYRPSQNSLFHKKAGIFTDSVFGVKYIAAQKEKASEDINGHTVYPDVSGRLLNDIYKKVYEDDTLELYENTAAFPILFPADERVKDIEFADTDTVLGGAFFNQQAFLNAVFANNDTYFTQFDIGEPKLENCTLESIGAAYKIRLVNLPEGRSFAQNEKEGGHITYTFTAPYDGEYCSDMICQTENGSKDALIHIINKIPTSNDALANHIYYDLGYFKAGETIKIEYYSVIDNSVITKPTLYMFNAPAFAHTAKIIQAASPQNIKLHKGVITADTNFTKDSFIFALITYSDNYKIYIDGKETEKTPIGKAFMGFNVPKGSHSIKIIYRPPYKAGAVISLITAVIFLVYLKNKGDQQNEK